jgi:hypothetical protein
VGIYNDVRLAGHLRGCGIFEPHLPNWRTQYDRMMRRFERLNQPYRSSVEYADDLQNLLQDSWHMKDWLRWAQVHVWSPDGSFHIGSQTDKKTRVALSYIHSSNTHVLEHAIRTAFKKAGAKNLSDILN